MFSFHNREAHHHAHDHEHNGFFHKLLHVLHSHQHTGKELDLKRIPGFKNTGSVRLQKILRSIAKYGIGEGPDDAAHGGEVVSGAAKSAFRPDPGHGSASHSASTPTLQPDAIPGNALQGMQYLGLPHSLASAGTTLGFSALSLPLGLYTFLISTHEINDIAHDQKKLSRKLQEIRQEITGIENPDAKNVEAEVTEHLANAHAENFSSTRLIVLKALEQYIDSTYEQNKGKKKFWRAAQVSGVTTASKGALEIGATSALVAKHAVSSVSSTAASAALAAGAATAFGIVPATAATVVGALFTKRVLKRGKQRQKDEQASYAKVEDALQSEQWTDEENKLVEHFKNAYKEKIAQSAKRDKRYLGLGTAFTASNALAVAAGVTALVGVLTAAPTFGASLAVTIPLSIALGVTAAAGTFSSLGVLPYEHVKETNREIFAEGGRTKEAALLAIGDVFHAGRGTILRSQHYAEICSRQNVLHKLLEKAASDMGKSYKPKEHKSDKHLPRASNDERQPTARAHRRKLSVSDLRKWASDENNKDALLDFIKSDLTYETQTNSYTSGKIALRNELFQKELIENASNENAEDENRIKAFQSIINAKDKPVHGVLEEFLAIRMGKSAGSIKNVHAKHSDDVYKKFSKYLLATDDNRYDRNTLFESQTYASQIDNFAKQVQEAGSVPRAEVRLRSPQTVTPPSEPPKHAASPIAQPIRRREPTRGGSPFFGTSGGRGRFTPSEPTETPTDESPPKTISPHPIADRFTNARQERGR